MTGMKTYRFEDSDISFTWLSGESEAGEWLERFARIGRFVRSYREAPLFRKAGWKRIGFPISFLYSDLSIREASGRSVLDFGNPQLQRNWFGEFLRVAHRDETADLCVVPYWDSRSVALVPPNAREIPGMFWSPELPFLYGQEVFLFDSEEKWAVYLSSEDEFFIAAEISLMEEFLEEVGGEDLLEYFFGSLLNESRGMNSGAVIRMIYSQTDWDVPFDLVEGDGLLKLPDGTGITKMVELDLQRKFGHRRPVDWE